MRRLETATLFVATLLLPGLSARGEGEDSMLTMPALGEFWYRMETAKGEAQGYAHLVLAARDGGGLRVDWELKLAFTGGTYEEERTLDMTTDGVLLAASISMKGKRMCEGRRDGSTWIVTTFQDGTKNETREVGDDLAAGMSFVIAAMLPAEEGTSRVFEESNDGQAFKSEGEMTVRVKGEVPARGSTTETIPTAGTEAKVRRVDILKANDVTLPIWVTEDRRIARVDWGGIFMLLSAEPTRDLFRPESPAVAEKAGTGVETLVMVGTLEKFTPEEVIDHFTKPDLLTKWWPVEADIDLKEGGKYELRWPAQEWTLTGTVREVVRGKRFSFTWLWAHDEEGTEPLDVTVGVAPAEGGGSQLSITHGPYTADEESQSERSGHADGWRFFVAKLRALRP